MKELEANREARMQQHMQNARLLRRSKPDSALLLA